MNVVETLGQIWVHLEILGSSYLLKWHSLKCISQTISSENSVTCWNASSKAPFESSTELKKFKVAPENLCITNFPWWFWWTQVWNLYYKSPLLGDCTSPPNSALPACFQLGLQLSQIHLGNWRRLKMVLSYLPILL